MKLLMKARSSLVSLEIPIDVPLLMNIILKLAKLQFEDVDTHTKVGLERKNYMVTTPVMLPEP